MPPLSKYKADQRKLVDMENADRETCLQLWWGAFRRVPPKHVSLRFMRRVLVHEEQCKMFGGLSTNIKRAFRHLLKQEQAKPEDAAVPTRPPTSLRPGNHLVREWNGRTYQVEVVESGFVFDGKTYASLSAIAKKITGAHWSGPRFFGLGKL